jgi:Flp pilus assembly protein TadD
VVVSQPDSDPGLVYELYQQGRRHLDRGNPTGAAEVLELAVAHEPRKASLHELLGRAYFGTARVRKARAEFARALELDPTDAYAHFGVGRCFEREGRVSEARTYYKLACALDAREDYRTALRRVSERAERAERAVQPDDGS